MNGVSILFLICVSLSRLLESRNVQQISVAEMRMLRWICGHTRRDRVRNDDIRDRLG